MPDCHCEIGVVIILLHALLYDRLCGSELEGHIDSDEDEDLLAGISPISVYHSATTLLVIPPVSVTCAVSGFGPPLPGGVQVLAATVRLFSKRKRMRVSGDECCTYQTFFLLQP